MNKDEVARKIKAKKLRERAERKSKRDEMKRIISPMSKKPLILKSTGKLKAEALSAPVGELIVNHNGGLPS